MKTQPLATNNGVRNALLQAVEIRLDMPATPSRVRQALQEASFRQ